MSNIAEEKLKEKIIIRLVRKDEVAEKDIPYKSIGDMAKVYHIAMDDFGVSVRIDRTLMDNLGITIDELDEIAMKYAPVNRPYTIKSIARVAMELMNIIEADDHETMNLIEDLEQEGKGMWVLKYDDDIYNGAAAICYPEALNDIGEAIGDAWIIPSSKHEMLVIKDGETSWMEFEKMIEEVNSTILRDDEKLSGMVFHYHPGDKEIEPGARWAARRAFE